MKDIEVAAVCGGRIVSMAVIVAVAVNTDGRREIILGITVMPSETFTGLTRPHWGHRPRSTFWADFLRSLTRRGLRGVQMVISDAHEGLKAAARKVLSAGWQRCRVQFQRNLLSRVGKTNKPVVSAVAKTVFAKTDRDQAHAAGARSPTTCASGSATSPCSWSEPFSTPSMARQ
ncbi:hypothetical protein C2I36_10970 [Rhodobacteraceae bacterium WD3A24]|nr:hypothetical protein C2I36_10970 [Rhodobacteraceae bacterium WD3A24]